MNVIFEGGFRRDGFERVLRRVGGATGVFWEACVGVASYRVARRCDQQLGGLQQQYAAVLQCCAARRCLAAVKATRSDAQHW